MTISEQTAAELARGAEVNAPKGVTGTTGPAQPEPAPAPAPVDG